MTPAELLALVVASVDTDYNDEANGYLTVAVQADVLNVAFEHVDELGGKVVGPFDLTATRRTTYRAKWKLVPIE